MRLRAILQTIAWGGALVFGAALAVTAWNVRSPFLIDWRPWPTAVLLTLSSLFACAVWRMGRRGPQIPRFAAMALGLIAVAIGGWREVHIAMLKSAVLAAPQAELRAAGLHIIAGFGVWAELEPLVIKAGIAGVFIARRNVYGRGAEDLARDTGRLQAMRRASGLPPLWIAADQEGGGVSALSPPLPPAPALSALAHAGELVINATRDTARELACAGVNVNFSPVVDVARRSAGPPAPVFRRSISTDERTVAQTARDYCRTLSEGGVQCVLKHFPGLGGVMQDTHAGKASLTELNEADLFPFRELARDEAPWIMLSHVTVENIDAERPASASRKVIDILRGDWGFDGLLITDDASMVSFAGDFERNTLDSLRGGADLLLVSWDPDLVYEALDAILRARRGDPVLARAMAQSDARLTRDPPEAAVCRRLARR